MSNLYGFKELGKALGVCHASAKTISRVRGLGPGRMVLKGKIWVETWDKDQVINWLYKQRGDNGKRFDVIR